MFISNKFQRLRWESRPEARLIDLILITKAVELQ